MSEPLVAVIVAVPEEFFPDDDDICLTACNFVCARLESHLVRHGHSIADWIKGGCEEDWGVYYESQRDTERFAYAISFFPVATGERQCYITVQYRLKVSFLKRLFRKRSQLGSEHPLHKTMEEFGTVFRSSRMLTQSQFDAEY
jgi:hypothetical protein